jgi:hypothetical protein
MQQAAPTRKQFFRRAGQSSEPRARQLRDQPGDVVIDEVKDYIEASFARDARRRLWRRGAFAAVAAVA